MTLINAKYLIALIIQILKESITVTACQKWNALGSKPKGAGCYQYIFHFSYTVI